MNYPLISEYVEAINAAEDNFEKLSYLRPVLGDDGQPVMTSGNFAVVFKMKDIQSGKLYAVKCFTKEQEGRAVSYKQIVEELNSVTTSYLTPIRYLDNELYVDTNNSNENEFPILLMDWVEGKPLDKFLRDNLGSSSIIGTLLENFYQLSEWFVAQPFAHGDLKPDNILVKDDASLVLVDYDGMYVPAMKGQAAREIGSPDFCHPLRNEQLFDEHIDDFSILSILLSLSILFINKNFLERYAAEDRLLFSKNDYLDIHRSNAYNNIPSIVETSTNYKKLFEKACENQNFHLEKESLTPVIMLIEARNKVVYDAIKGVLERHTLYPGLSELLNASTQKEKKTDIITIPSGYTQHHAASNTTCLSESINQKDKKSTRWQSALLLQILTMLYPLLLFSNDYDSDDFWTAMGWGFGVGLIAWVFAFFDYIKRDGSFSNCLFAFLLFPLTLYYGIYRIICMCINMFKE